VEPIFLPPPSIVFNCGSRVGKVATEEFSVRSDDLIRKVKDILEGKNILSDLDLKAISTPGHTPGSTCYYSGNEGILISGDTIYPDGYFGRTDLQGGSSSEMKKSCRHKQEFTWVNCYNVGVTGAKRIKILNNSTNIFRVRKNGRSEYRNYTSNSCNDLPDVQATAPNIRINLTRVGVKNVKKLIEVARPGKRPVIFISNFHVFVDLQAE
jgi:hypothetical protein